MGTIRAPAPEKENDHEQDHPHPEASVLPYYAAALVFVVLCAVLPVYRLWALQRRWHRCGGDSWRPKRSARPVWWKPRCPSTRVVEDVDAMLADHPAEGWTLCTA